MPAPTVSTHFNAIAMRPDTWTHAPWMFHAFAELGVKEEPGVKDNPRIVEYHATTDGPVRVHDSTAWCSSFANWSMNRANVAGTRSKAARSWLRWGQPIVKPALGCVVVFWRQSKVGKYGHVGFYLGEQDSNIVVLGGNQGNSVSVALYPRRRLLAYRMPA